MKPNPSVISIAFLIGAVLLYTGAIQPLSESLNHARETLSREEKRLAATKDTITKSPNVRTRIESLEASNTTNRTQVLSPLLNSYAMRAKALLSDIAFESGLTNVEFGEGGFWALPLPPEYTPAHRTGRRSVKIQTQADYAAAISFILRAEKEIPLMTVQALSIVPAKTPKADLQAVEIVLEWPCEGEDPK